MVASLWPYCLRVALVTALRDRVVPTAHDASAEFTGSHTARVHAREIRHWVTERIEQLLQRLEHRSPRATAEQLMMVRTGAVVSCALDDNADLNQDFLTCWEKLIDDGLASA